MFLFFFLFFLHFWGYFALGPIFLKSGGRTFFGKIYFRQNPTFFLFFFHFFHFSFIHLPSFLRSLEGPEMIKAELKTKKNNSKTSSVEVGPSTVVVPIEVSGHIKAI